MENKKKKNLKNIKKNEVISIFLSFIIILYFIYGFYSNENSAGAGGYEGDFKIIWKNLLLFKENILINLDSLSYHDSRPPLSYILHVILNPFLESQGTFRFSVLVISAIVPLLLFFSIKENHTNTNNYLILLIALIITLSPYFRTSSYWGLGENYGLIFLISSYLLFIKFKKNYNNKNNLKSLSILFFLCLSSSICIYFDQKLIFIPFFIFANIMISKFDNKIKFIALAFFIIFAMPYLYLINIWGSIIPPLAASAREVGQKMNLYHIGYCLTIVGFYIAPLILFKNINFLEIKKKLLSKNFFRLTIIFFIYIFLLIFLGDFKNLSNDGKGLFHKLFIIIFENNNLRLFFTFVFFYLGLKLIYIFCEKKEDVFIILYLLILSLLTFPFYQEYLDPLIYILAFTFFNTKLNLNFKKTYFMIVYFLIFSLGSKLYYNIIL